MCTLHCSVHINRTVLCWTKGEEKKFVFIHWHTNTFGVDNTQKTMCTVLLSTVQRERELKSDSRAFAPRHSQCSIDIWNTAARAHWYIQKAKWNERRGKKRECDSVRQKFYCIAYTEKAAMFVCKNIWIEIWAQNCKKTE